MPVGKKNISFPWPFRKYTLYQILQKCQKKKEAVLLLRKLNKVSAAFMNDMSFTSRGCRRYEAQHMKLWSPTANGL